MRRSALLLSVALPLICANAWANPGHDSQDLLGSFIGNVGNKASHPTPSEDALGGFLQARQLLFTNRILPQTETQAAPELDLTVVPAHNRPLYDAHTLMMSDVVVTAMGYLGKPYSWGESSLAGGFDCSGFVLSLYQRSIGHQLPRRAVDQAQATTKISKAELKPGDLVFFNTLRRPYSHVGIYIGEGRFIHSPRAGARIRVESMEKAYWQTRFNGARRVAAHTTAQLASR